MKKTVSKITDSVQYLTTCLFKVSMSLTISIDAKMRYNDYRKAETARFQAEETAFWLELLHESGRIDSEMFQPLYTLTEEVIKILVTIIRNKRESIQNSRKQTMQ